MFNSCINPFATFSFSARMHLCAHAHVCGLHVYNVCTCLCRQWVNVGRLRQLSLTLFIEAATLTGSLVHHLSWSGWPASPRNLPVPAPSAPRLQVHDTLSGFYLDAEGSNSDPYACVADTLETEGGVSLVHSFAS